MDVAPVGYKRTGVGEIPEDWKSSSVWAIASSTRNAIVGGPFGSDLVSKDYVSHGVPVIRGRNMSGRWVSGSFAFVAPTKAKSLEANLAHPGDIIFTQRGTLGQVSLVPDKPFSAYVVSQSQMKLSVNPKVANPLFLFYFFISYEQQKSIQGRTIQTGVPHINLGILREMPVRLPPLAEQGAIAEALSDVDGLLAALEALIAKKRDIKQATMQQLLTGKTRLPGFSGDWETKQLGKIATVTKGTQLHRGAIVKQGRFPHLNGGIHPSGYASTFNTLSNTIAVSEGGNSCGYVQFMTVPYWCGGHCYSVLSKGIDNHFLYHALKVRQTSIMALRVGSGLPNVQKPALKRFELEYPISKSEQTAIATIFSDMDAEIAALERRRDKTRAIKQGMMQQLLTGRVRLVKPRTTTEVLAASKPIERKHNWQFNEAVLISVLAKNFGNEQYPLGRLRYTKLSYLLHRREQGHAEGYLRKAAGPYNPQTRYGGPEKIALKKDYVHRFKSGQRQGFIAGTNFEEAKRYFDKWYGSDVLKWLDNFRYKTNNHLELLTTADMAAEELCEAGEKVSVESVKAVIRSHPEWNAKLDRPNFSDAKLARAIESCQKYFPRSSRQETE